MNRLLTRIAVIAFLCLFALCGYGQEKANTPLSKDSIIQMSKAGLPDDVIVSKIRAEASPPDFSTDDLIALKAAGVSDAVIRALVSPGAKPDSASAAASSNSVPPDPNDPLAAHDPGIYLMTTAREGGKKMVLLERAGTGREKTAHVLKAVMTDGIAKAQVRAEVPGPRSAVRADVKPEFYMYFPPTGNLGQVDSISSPSQFSLLRLEKKKNHRETTVAKQGLGRASAGLDEKKTIKFTAEKFRAYAYKVRPNDDLKAGEYAFIASTGISATGMGGTASGGAVAIYDFGVDE
jgi:hypothetical protein